MKLSSFLFVMFIFLSSFFHFHCMDIYEDYSKFKNVAIYTYTDDCRRCYTLKDYSLKSFSFDECSLDINPFQRFDFKKGKSSKVFSYQIYMSGSSTQIINGNISSEFYILPATSEVHGVKAVNIIGSNSYECFTETYSNVSFPYNQGSDTFFQNCSNSFDNKLQKFYLQVGTLSPMFYKGTLSFYEFNTNITQNALDMINTNYPDFTVYYSTGTNQDTNLSFKVNSPTIAINLPQQNLDYNVYNNMSTLNNPGFYCYFIVNNANSNKMSLPFNNKFRCNVGFPNYFHMDINVTRYNKTEFNIYNTTRETYMTTSVFADNSNIVFTSSTESLNFNVATSNVSSFIRPLIYGSYTTSLTLKTNPDMDVFTGLSFVINTCNYTLISIPVKEKIVKATVTFKDYLTNNNLNTSYYLANSNINFIRTSTGVNYSFNVGSGGQSSIMNILHFGTYTISSFEITEWEEYTTGITVNGYSDTAFTLFLRERKVYATFTIKNIADSSNLSTSNFVLYSNISFTRTSTGAISTYDIGAGNQVSFSLWLYFGSYSINSLDHPEWLRLTNTFSINNYSDTNFTIFLEIKAVNVTFSIFQANNFQLNSACFPIGSNIAFLNTSNNVYTYYNNNIKTTNFVVPLIPGNYNIATNPSQENQEGCGGQWGYKRWNLTTTSITVTKSTTNISIIITESGINVTFKFNVTNLFNILTSTCFLPGNTKFTFSASYESGQNISVDKYFSCSPDISVILVKGSWYITYKSEYNIQDLAINPQVFNVANYNGETHYIGFYKYLQTSHYLKYIKPNNDIESLGNVTIECSGNSKALTYFHAALGHSNIMNFWYFCRELNSNGTVTDYNSPVQAYERTHLDFWYLGMQSMTCASNSVLKKFRIIYDLNNLTYYYQYSCIHIFSASSSGSWNSHGSFPYLSADGFDRIRDLKFGNISNFINAIQIFGGNDIRTINYMPQTQFFANPINLQFYEISNTDVTSFNGVALNPAECPTNWALTFYAHVNDGSKSSVIYICRELNSGYVGAIISDSHVLTWQPGGSSNIFYDRQFHDCGSAAVTKSRKLLYDAGTGNIIKSVECYQYNAPKAILTYSWAKNDCSDSNLNKLNGFTWGDGLNFIVSMKMTMYSACKTESKIFVPLN